MTSYNWSTLLIEKPTVVPHQPGEVSSKLIIEEIEYSESDSEETNSDNDQSDFQIAEDAP